MRKSILFLVLLGVASLMLGPNGNVYSQDAGDPPPRIIDVWPLPGVELAGQESLSITFDQAMDQDSVAAAFSTEPALEGSLTWTDARTVEFVPSESWPRNTNFDIQIANSAQALTGVTLEDNFQTEVKTIGPLVVSTVVPDTNAEGVAADARIVVTFNRPVVALGTTEDMAALPSPITTEPAIAGKGEWLNTSIYMLTPDTPLQGGSSYTVRVAAGLTAVDGAVLDEAFEWTFATLPPQILRISPFDGQQEVALDRDITVEFSQPMERESTTNAFALLFRGERVAGDISWNESGTTLTFSPAENLQIESTYLLNIADTAQSAAGEATLDRGYSQSFETVPFPGVERTNPNNGQTNVSPGGGAFISFKSAMNTDTFEGLIEVSPEPDQWTPVVNGNRSLSIQFNSQPLTTYTITLKAGAEDVYGNAIPTDYTFSYSTRDIDTFAYPIIGGYYNAGLQLTGSYRNNTRFSVLVSGKPEVQFQLWQLSPTDLGEFGREVLDYGYYSGDGQLPPYANTSNLYREWTQRFDSEGVPGIAKEVLLASEEGGVLPEGLYWLRMRAPSPYSDEVEYSTFALGVVNANLTVKRAPEETLVWVTHMPSAQPVQETTVSVVDEDGNTVARGQTDADGLFRAPIAMNENDFFTVVAEGAGAYGLWKSYDAGSPNMRAKYLYTDRPIYRPGETVHFRGMLREKDDMQFSIPNQRTVNVVINGTDGSELYNETVEITPFGTFSGSLELADDAPLGDAYIYAAQSSLRFTIAEFRVPEFQVGVTAQQDSIFRGDELNAIANATFFAGGAVSNAEVTWNANAQQSFFNYTGPGRYNFYDDTLESFFSYFVGSGEGMTDDDGNFIINTGNTDVGIPRPATINVEASVTDESFQTISGRTSVMVHPSNAYVGLRSDRYFGREGEDMLIDVISVSPDSMPRANQRVNLTFVELRWSRIPVEGQFGRYNWEREEIEVESVEVVTNENGTSSYSFTPPNAGIFRVRATTLDERERLNSSSLRFYVTGEQSVWWGEPSDRIDLIANQDSYEVGDTAEILVPLPFAGSSTVLVTTERQGILSTDVVPVEGSTLLYELPIIDAHVPTVHVSVAVVKGIDDESANPQYKLGELALRVEPTQQTLTVTATPSAEQTQPGDTLNFDLQVNDADGNPVVAELGVALTDKAILSLLPANSGPVQDAFYGFQPNYTRTTIALEALLDSITDRTVGEDDDGVTEEEELAEADLATGGANDQAFADEAMPTAAPATEAARSGEGAQQQPEVDVREDFEQTPLWEAHVVTDENGFATVSLELPDNLTTWTLDARVISVETEVGQTTTEVMTTLPLLVRPTTPRFFVVDDRVELAAVINNNSPEEQTVNVTLEAEGVTLESDVTTTLTIPANSRGRAEWDAVVQDVEFVDLTFIAIGADGYQDAAKPQLATGPDGTIPVYRYTAPDRVGTSGILREEGASVEGISLPTRFDFIEGDLVLNADPSLAAATTDALDYLQNYEHQCIEQTVSRFLPNIANFRALRDLGIEDPVLEAKLFDALDFGLGKLTREQNPDGGWGWFSGMRSSELVTAYAVLGLIEARDAGFAVDQGMIDRALNFVRQNYIRPSLDRSFWELNRQAFFVYVLAQDEQGTKAELDALHEFRLNMSLAGRAYLTMAYNDLFPGASEIDDLVSDFTTNALVSATGVHWEEDRRDWWNWGSNTRTTALVLNALIQTRPESDLLPNAVRWLMVARDGDHWQTTQENVWALLALTDWMVLTNELQGNYEFTLSLNREELLSGQVTPDNVRDENQLRIAVSDLLMDDLNRLVISRAAGEGALYYTAHLDLRLPASQVDALSRGITVTREYFAEGDPETPITSATVGDRVSVRLTITLPEDVYYFVLEDPIPAGTEAVNTALRTTSQQADGPELVPSNDNDWRWFWGWWYFDHTELRDEQVNLYADYLPRGTYTYTYQLQATVPGEFQTMPAEGYAFYFPEVFGRTDGELFTIEDRAFGAAE